MRLLSAILLEVEFLRLYLAHELCLVFFFSSRRRHTRFDCDWSSDVCSSDLEATTRGEIQALRADGTLVRQSTFTGPARRSEERRVGKECRSRWSPYH